MAVFAGGVSEMVSKMDIIHINGTMETYSLVSSKMEREMAIAYTDMLIKKQLITGSLTMIKQRDTES